MRWRHAITKKYAFCAFSHVQPKHQNGNILVDVEGFRPCLSKPSYRAPKLALMVRLMQKERLKSTQKLPIRENQASWVILAILAKTPILVILASHFRTRVETPKKCHLRPCLHQPEKATIGFGGVYTHRKPEARRNFLLPGVWAGLPLISFTFSFIHPAINYAAFCNLGFSVI